jgi:hypothetical protein
MDRLALVPGDLKHGRGDAPQRKHETSRRVSPQVTTLADWYQRRRSAAAQHFSTDIDVTQRLGYT